MAENAANPKDQEPAEVMRCPTCMEANYPDAHFCRKCGMPLSAMAGMDPLKQIYAEGWIFRRAVSGRPSVIVLLGMWLIFGPALVLTVVAAGPVLSGGRSASDILSLLLTAGFAILYGAILLRVTLRYAHRRRQPPGHCEECGHPVSDPPARRCPECGAVIDQASAPGEGGNPP
jgi:hypothetical protein